MPKPILHQLSAGAAVGDAITSQILVLQRWLREQGFVSEIFAEHIQPDIEKQVHSIATYRPNVRERHVIYHHSIGSDVVDDLLARQVRLVLIYHNVTPPQFFQTSDPALAQQMIRGREQLIQLRERTDLALGISPYNEQELVNLGFAKTDVLPLILDESQYNQPDNPSLLKRFGVDGPILCYVGRIVPNKKQEDLLKLLYFYRRIEPKAQLLLVGRSWLPAYDDWLRDLAYDLGLSEAVHFLGHVSQQDMVTCYKRADLYISMSEHEGFGLPLVESMYLQLPVLAYAAGGVPSTLGEAGVLFHHKDYEALAELVDMLISDESLQQALINQQRKRVQAFLEPQVRQRWQTFLQMIEAF